jgi:chromosome segregation ATPase
MAEQSGQNGNRANLWALIAGGLGIVLGIVALVVAITTNHSSNDNAKIEKAVQVAEARQISGVQSNLHRNVAAATAVLKHLQRDSARAHHADAALKHDVKLTKTGVVRNQQGISANKSQIAVNGSKISSVAADVSNLQNTTGGLNADIRGLRNTIATQQKQQQAMARHIKSLQNEVNNLP